MCQAATSVKLTIDKFALVYAAAGRISARPLVDSIHEIAIVFAAVRKHERASAGKDTVNEAADVQKLLDLDTDCIITDRVDLFSPAR